MNEFKGTLFLVGLTAVGLLIGWLIKRMEDKHKKQQKMQALNKLVEDEFDRMQKTKDDIAR